MLRLQGGGGDKIIDFNFCFFFFSDPKTKLQLRLPDECREVLEWPSTSKILALKLYIKQKYPELTRDKYKILNTSTFPKRNILDLNDETTFDKCDLHPFCILYIHPDD